MPWPVIMAAGWAIPLVTDLGFAIQPRAAETETDVAFTPSSPAAGPRATWRLCDTRSSSLPG